MKKLLAIILCLAMVLSMAACGKKEEAVEPVDKTALTGKVRFWTPFKEEQGMGDIISAFNEKYPNIEVEIFNYSNNADGNVALTSAIMAEEVDVILCGGFSWTFPRWDAGQFIDISDRLAADGLDVKTEWGTDMYVQDGHVYVLPAAGQSKYVAINMDAWNAAGLGALPTEWTWDEYLAASEAMTVRDANGNTVVYGGSDVNSIPTFAWVQYNETGHDYLYDPETGLSSFGSPLLLNSLKREIKAELEDKIWYPLATYRAENVQCPQIFVQGGTNSTITFNVTRTLADTANNKMDSLVGFAPYPVEEKGDYNYLSNLQYYIYNAMVKGCQDEDASWEFLKFLSTYGMDYMPRAGYYSTWQGAGTVDLADVTFGSKEAAAKIVDLDSFYAWVGRNEGEGAYDIMSTAFNEIDKIKDTYAHAALKGEMTAEDALAQAQAEMDAAIKAAQGK